MFRSWYFIAFMRQIWSSFFRNSFEGHAWVGLIYGGGSWSVWTTVNATKREDTGKLNSSPVTSTAPVVRVQQNCERVIDIIGKATFFIWLIDIGDGQDKKSFFSLILIVFIQKFLFKFLSLGYLNFTT